MELLFIFKYLLLITKEHKSQTFNLKSKTNFAHIDFLLYLCTIIKINKAYKDDNSNESCHSIR